MGFREEQDQIADNVISAIREYEKTRNANILMFRLDTQIENLKRAWTAEYKKEKEDIMKSAMVRWSIFAGMVIGLLTVYNVFGVQSAVIYGIIGIWFFQHKY